MKVSNSASFNLKLKKLTDINPDFLTVDNEKQLNKNDPYEILTEKIDSTKTKAPKLITTLDNVNNIRFKKYEYPKPKIKLPLIKSNRFLTEADLILKKDKKLEGLSPIHIPINIKIKQSCEINLKNNLIKKIIEKRKEIKNNEKNYINKINKRNEDYKKKYKNYLTLVENGQKKQKEEEGIYNILKTELKEKEKILKNEIEENQILNLNKKKIINEILIYKKYGQFIHKIFGQKFIYDQLKNFDGKNYDKISEEIIEIFNNYNYKEDNSFDEMLKSQGDYYFFMNWLYFEAKIRNQLNKKNKILEELNELNINIKNDLNNLNKKKEEINKDKNLYYKNKKEENLKIKEFREYYTINDIRKYLKYIIELSNLICNDFIYKNNSNTENDILEESSYICKEGIKCFEKKEEKINKYINEINDIFNKEKDDDIKLIEKIINERRKLNARVKQQELNKMKEIIKRKNMFKTIDTQKIVIKGRKAFPKYPFFKQNNQKNTKKISPNENLLSEYYDYICYSEDEN